MLQSTQGAFGAVVLAFDQSKARSAQIVQKPEPRKDRPCISLLSLLDQFKMVTLQRNNRDDEKMIFRDKNDLYWHFNKSGTGFGAYKNGELVSMILMKENNDLPSEVRGTLEPSALEGRHAIIGGAIVDKKFRGMGLCVEMIESCISDALISRYDHLHARVRVGNEESMVAFKKAGFTVLPQTGPSPDAPEHTVHFLHLDMKDRRESWGKPRSAKIYEFTRQG
jgi:RimJ/RimL family protein N-acetyltransferase